MDETRAMSDQIRHQFDQVSMESAQQKIDAYDYFSNLKKLMLYGSKLSTYAEYEKDLTFAKDNELFKGLPEDPDDNPESKTRFVTEKYKKMMQNVKDEIETYKDLILISLDACELLSSNDLTGFVTSKPTRQRIQSYFENSPDYQDYLEKKERLDKTWPMLESRINYQISIWEIKGSAPHDPIIDINITKAIQNDDAV